MKEYLNVDLPIQFSEKHEQLILKYLVLGRHAITLPEWKQIINAFDLLNQARVRYEDKVQTFKQIFAIHVEQPFADLFINELLVLNDVSREYQSLRARFARKIVDRLQSENLRQSGMPETNLLLAYCLYFWESFALGYTFEVEIYRDLSKSGVFFEAHDIRESSARYSSYDLLVMDLKGDIKASLYFLHAARTRGLPHDFYITRFYEGNKQRTWVVMMQPEAWDQINGDTVVALLEEASQQFPSPVMVQVLDRHVVIMEYNVWKERVLQKQHRK